MGGYRVELRPGTYPDGRTCVVASHPDLPGCVAYADKEDAAMDELRAAREAYLASLRRHNEAVPQPLATTTTTHWQMTVPPVIHHVVISPTFGANPALQTA